MIFSYRSVFLFLSMFNTVDSVLFFAGAVAGLFVAVVATAVTFLWGENTG